MNFKVGDIVKVKSSGKIAQITKITMYETQELIGSVVRSNSETYYTLDGGIHSHKGKQLELVENNLMTAEEFDKLIIDINLANKNFDFLKRYMRKGENENE